MICHLQDTRRMIGSGQRRGKRVTLIPVICAVDLLVSERGGDSYTTLPELVTCSDCKGRIIDAAAKGLS